MQRLLLLVLCLAAIACEGAPVDFTLDSPGWGGEVITLPPGFAPNMRIKGVEDIRFAPGMFKPNAEDFFSYIFVITSNTGQTFEASFVHQELFTYYQGLAKAVSKGSIDPSGFVLNLEPADSAHKATYTGRLDWIEPFATRKAQTLYFDVEVRVKDEREYLIVCVSPQKMGHAIWKALYQVRSTFRRVTD
jgi:hypothetical protein